MKISGTELVLVKGDITQMQVDAIVNAANSSLLGGGGVDGAIHRKGGGRILEECKVIRSRQGGCKTGEAVYTTGGLLPAKYIIHTVGPVWNNGLKGESSLLASCYTNSLILAASLNIKTIAFPCISTGVYRYPQKDAAQVAFNSVKHFLENEQSSLLSVYFVCFDDENHTLYRILLDVEAENE